MTDTNHYEPTKTPTPTKSPEMVTDGDGAWPPEIPKDQQLPDGHLTRGSAHGRVWRDAGECHQR